MKFRVISDVHNEFYRGGHFNLPIIEGEKDMCLLMAGDIGLLHSPTNYKSFVDEMTKRHKHVFWIEGNHEFYHGNISTHSIGKVIQELNYNNLHTQILKFDEEKIVVLGCTLWTDFDKNDPMVLFESNHRMNDFRIIRKGLEYSKYKAEDAFATHHSQRKYLFEDVAELKKKGYTVIVVTHHHPSFQGVKEEYIGDLLNGAYCSDLSKEISETKPDYWVCGHIHKHQTYEIFDTKVFCNPVGYPHEYDVNFDPNFVFEI